MISFILRDMLSRYEQLYTFEGWCLYTVTSYPIASLLDIPEKEANWLCQQKNNLYLGGAYPMRKVDWGAHVACGRRGWIVNAWSNSGRMPVCRSCKLSMPPHVHEHLVKAMNLLQLSFA